MSAGRAKLGMMLGDAWNAEVVTRREKPAADIEAEQSAEQDTERAFILCGDLRNSPKTAWRRIASHSLFWLPLRPVSSSLSKSRLNKQTRRLDDTHSLVCY